MTDVWSRYRIGKLRILSGHCRIHREAPGAIPMMKINASISPSPEGLFYGQKKPATNGNGLHKITKCEVF